ncbi:MAG: hypothetical protein ACO222_06365 [Polynucleobacter sp.]
MNKIENTNSDNLTNRGRGRPKGSLNKATKTFRDTVNTLLEDNSENVQKWLKEVADGDVTSDRKPDPKGALDLLAKLAEYAAPKLARTEITGKDGGALEFADMSDNELDSKIKDALLALNGKV